METVLQALGAMLAAAGLLALAWFCFGKLLLPVSGEGGGPVYAVLPAAGEGETLEHDVRALCWLRGSEAARFTIVIADGGLSEQGLSLIHISPSCTIGRSTARSTSTTR